MPPHPRPWIAPVLLSLFAVGLLTAWWDDGRPVPMPDAPASRLACISYSPSGAVDGMPRDIPESRIRSDLTLLAQRYECVRTYSVSHGLGQVPAIAREVGLDVLLGAWIGRDAELNAAEVSRALEIAREHREVIRAIVVGNEVLLRHEMPPAKLAALIRHVRDQSGLPVTYADVWGFWVRHQALAEAVSFVTVHIIPYWDDDPVGIDEVIPYVDGLYAEMRREFPGKSVLIGETGWPSVGRPRGANEPGRVNQARFIREFTQLAAQRDIPYNLIEAFDQPWKRPPEGTVGGYWGLQDTDGRDKFEFAGPVAEIPWAPRLVGFALLAGLLGAIGGAIRGRPNRARAAVVLAATATIVVSVAARQWRYITFGNTNVVDWIATSSVGAIGWLALLRVLPSLAYAAPGPSPGGVVASWRSARSATERLVETRVDSTLRALLLVAAAYVSLGLVFAGRHRDFPIWLFLPGVIACALWALEAAREHGVALRRDRAIEEWLLAAWLVVSALLVPWLDDFANLPSIAWGLSALALGLAVLGPVQLQTSRNEQSAQRAHT